MANLITCNQCNVVTHGKGSITFDFGYGDYTLCKECKEIQDRKMQGYMLKTEDKKRK